MILTEIGEIGVHYEGLELILSPSLYAMSKLGSPKEIVDTFHCVMGGSIAHSLAVIQVCADGDIRDIFGYMDGNLEFNEMFASTGEIVIVAQSLLYHGIIGDVKREDKKSTNGEFTKEFHAKEYVSAVIAHLGISEKEAWKMTMTSVSGALQAKFPPVNDGKTEVTGEVINESYDWFDKLDEVRRGK